ncbi:STM4015 family protein [Streptomyces sp. NBC_01433]|uniref:STM4015 family protein n=1 Tax=Streptomyces sp. NBC_01433 TaxID=2903864 RepID=UPI00225119B1|nr:STM4015 family protein [Streptomyces sp. NBC_01433]MCX4679992.1 STM4015 family protein [Streptomyces sp. NBC_01433]
MLDIAHPEFFHDLPVFTLPGPAAEQSEELPAADEVAWRLDCGWEGSLTFPVLWQHFLDSVDSERAEALVIGPWWQGHYTELTPVVELIAADAGRFPGLRALFLADVESEECEVSWLKMSDITPVLAALPLLEELVVRGGGDSAAEEAGLRLSPVRHSALRSLRFESGGLPSHVVRAVAASELPALERLEIWLGTRWYGGDAQVEDLAPLLSGGTFARLRHLGLQNSEIQDEIAAALASAPVVAQLTSLSLAMGTLGDTGAAALLAGQPLSHLSTLDLRHHYLSDGMLDRVRQACAPASVNGEEPVEYWDPEEDEERYVAVSE